MRHSWKNLLFRSTSVAAALAAFLFTATPLLRADDRDCQRRIVRADHKLDQAVSRHGFRSRQAQRARQELRQARERCWNVNHRWWDEHDRRWRTERDWNDNDHDGDRDHDHDHH